MKKLRHYAIERGVTYRTAYNHFKRGLIDGAYQLPTGTVVIPDRVVPPKVEYTVTYARVSSSENKINLASQSKRLVDFCNAKGWQVKEAIEEIGSGVNDGRKKLLKILSDGRATRIVVEHKDRLTRFGFNYINEACRKFGCEIVIVNDVGSEREDIIQDFVSIITSFCISLYGNKNKAQRLINELTNETQKS